MAVHEKIVAQVLEASSGKVVGRIRLQKMVYLLQQLGSGSDFKFSYHHYGPYSEEVSVAVQRASVLDKTISENEKLSKFGGWYSEFDLIKPINSEFIGRLSIKEASQYAEIMKAETSVVLELAATIHWLKNKEQLVDWTNELQSRKPGKATIENIARAKELLAKLKIAA